MLGALGFSFINILNKHEKVHVELAPIFVAIFAFAFAVSLGVIWEIYEFTFDGILGLNMEDLIVDCIGAFTMSTIGYISLKYKKGWIEKLLIKMKK